MAGKRNAIKEAAARKEWGQEHVSGGCMICGIKKADWRGFTVHHIRPGRDGRSDEPCNYLLVCGLCHDLCEGLAKRDNATGLLVPTVPDGMQMTMKWLRDPDDWNLKRLAELSWGERLPLMEPPHSWINGTYQRNQPRLPRPWAEKYLEDLERLNEWIDTYMLGVKLI
jgi:hypothetical protein